MTGKSTTRGRLARAQELREHKRRQEDFHTQEVLKYYAEQKALDAAAASALKDDLKRREREARERQAEQNLVEGIYKTEKERELAALRAEEESKLATAVLTQYASEERERGEIHSLHARHEVLRELALKLKTAQVSRERDLQKKENVLKQAQEKEYTSSFDAALERERLAAVAAEEQHQWNRRMLNMQARDVLQEQMEDRVEQQRLARLEHEHERTQVDDVMRAIEEEDRLQLALKRRKATETMEYIRAILSEREEQREFDRRTNEEEERKIQEYLQEVKRREEERQAAIAAHREEADRIYVKLKAEKEAAMAAKEQEEFLINLLRQEENEAKIRKQVEDRKAYEERMRREMLEANRKQMEMKALREAAMREEEEEFKRQMLAQFAEDDRIEQMNAQKRRMKMLEHRREVERLIDAKRKMYEDAKREQEAWEQRQREREARELDIVERERRKLLREAADLLDYLPKGVLRNHDDLDYVLSLAKELKEKGSIK